MSALRRLAARRPHVLLIPAPGSDPLRRAVEAALDARRWPVASSPADADVLLVVGRAGPQLTAVADAVWATVPAPRTRGRVRRAAELTPALDAAVAALRGPAEPAPDVDAAGADTVLAGLADDDPDGLALDALHVPLGPVLPAWPPGLVVHAVLAGDRITAATAEVLDAGVARPAGDATPDVRRLDALAAVLTLSGRDAAARRARQLRDAVDTRQAPGRAGAHLADRGDVPRRRDDPAAFGRRIAGSRLLGAMLRDVPLTAPHPADPHADASHPGGPHPDGPRPGGPARDRTVADRVRRWCRELGTDAPADARPDADTAVAALVGLELGAARLALAALDPDTSAAPDPATGAIAAAPRRGRRT